MPLGVAGVGDYVTGAEEALEPVREEGSGGFVPVHIMLYEVFICLIF